MTEKENWGSNLPPEVIDDFLTEEFEESEDE